MGKMLSPLEPLALPLTMRELPQQDWQPSQEQYRAWKARFELQGDEAAPTCFAKFSN